MKRLRAFVVRHKSLVVSAGLLAVAGVVFVLVWFQPQKYFLNSRVDEAQVPEGVTLAGGDFQSLEHGTSGRALIQRLPDGSLVLRFEDLDTLNGPDLHVYLSEVPAGDDARAYGEGYIDLGKLKANKGSQNYDVPSGTDVSAYRSVVIWCKRFTVGFGVAPLQG